MRITSILSLVAYCLGKIDQAFINNDVEIKSNLGTHDLRQEIVIKATAMKDISVYQVVIPPAWSKNVSILKATKGSDQLAVSSKHAEEYELN